MVATPPGVELTWAIGALKSEVPRCTPRLNGFPTASVPVTIPVAPKSEGTPAAIDPPVARSGNSNGNAFAVCALEHHTIAARRAHTNLFIADPPYCYRERLQEVRRRRFNEVLEIHKPALSLESRRFRHGQKCLRRFESAVRFAIMRDVLAADISLWGASSVGRARRSQRRGRGFKSPALHHSGWQRRQGIASCHRCHQLRIVSSPCQAVETASSFPTDSS